MRIHMEKNNIVSIIILFLVVALRIIIIIISNIKHYDDVTTESNVLFVKI